MPRTRSRLRRSSLAACLLASGSALAQAASVAAGYVTGSQDRALAVAGVLVLAYAAILMPIIIQDVKKNWSSSMLHVACYVERMALQLDGSASFTPRMVIPYLP